MLLLVAPILSSAFGSLTTLHSPWCNPDCAKAKTLHVMGITRVLGHCGNSPNNGSAHMERSVPHAITPQIPEDTYPKQ